MNYDAVLRKLEKLTLAPTPWWDRPMHSAYVTDEPDPEAAAAAVASRTSPRCIAARAAPPRADRVRR